MVGNFVTWPDGLDCANLDDASHDIRFRIGLTRMIDIARDVSPVGAVDRPAAIDLEKVFRTQIVGRLGGNSLAPIFDDEGPFPDRSDREQSETCSGAGNAEWLIDGRSFHRPQTTQPVGQEFCCKPWRLRGGRNSKGHDRALQHFRTDRDGLHRVGSDMSRLSGCPPGSVAPFGPIPTRRRRDQFNQLLCNRHPAPARQVC